eukprot:CAMPEP_0183789832 /NCGR_PEP_ID=MMETSP0803_2-20130417/659_1 /TAXON_ID=195967 /ORGANISM="Crustomastix stigmata, Strain CCMP3273" /LENGTH=455 /DNA_ID=CAMNT_0026034013 /DNA_START=53 /DNA_END=1420 /DNA_ORIENTATION=+
MSDRKNALAVDFVGGALIGGAVTALTMLMAPKKKPFTPQVELLPQPKNPKCKLVHVGFTSPEGDPCGAPYNTDKNKHGVRYDAVGIANGCIEAGASCVLFQYDAKKPEEAQKYLDQFDGFIVRVNPGQLSNPGCPAGAQEVFDNMMREFVKTGKPVWSSPDVQIQMGAKDALVKINNMNCGLPDTFAYYEEKELVEGFKKTAAFQPRVIKQNRGSAGEGIWLCWLQDKEYCKKFGDAVLQDSDKLKLMEMNDNHVEYHTVKEFLEFCVNGPGGKAGKWNSAFPGKYLEGGKEAGGQLVDQRLLPRITEGEVRMLMVKDTLFQIIHKKPVEGGLSAVGGINIPTFYAPNAPEYKDLRKKFEGHDIPQLLKAMNLDDQPLPLLWTGDFIPADGEKPGSTVYIVGEFNCSCVGITFFGKGCGPDKDYNDVADDAFAEGMALCELIGKKAVEGVKEFKK